MDNNGKITVPCPKCGCDAKRIAYLNSGPIVRLWCPQCTFHVYDYLAWEKGYSGANALFNYWNDLKPEEINWDEY